MNQTTITDRGHTTPPPDVHDILDLGRAADTDAGVVVAAVGVVSSSWSDVPVDERYDAPIPFTAPAWLQLSRAEEYDDYDAAIPFHVVNAYTQHMTDHDGDSLDL